MRWTVRCRAEMWNLTVFRGSQTASYYRLDEIDIRWLCIIIIAAITVERCALPFTPRWLLLVESAYRTTHCQSLIDHGRRPATVNNDQALNQSDTCWRRYVRKSGRGPINPAGGDDYPPLTTVTAAFYAAQQRQPQRQPVLLPQRRVEVGRHELPQLLQTLQPSAGDLVVHCRKTDLSGRQSLSPVRRNERHNASAAQSSAEWVLVSIPTTFVVPAAREIAVICVDPSACPDSNFWTKWLSSRYLTKWFILTISRSIKFEGQGYSHNSRSQSQASFLRFTCSTSSKLLSDPPTMQRISAWHSLMPTTAVCCSRQCCGCYQLLQYSHRPLSPKCITSTIICFCPIIYSKSLAIDAQL